jgi:hypothetical protein
MEQNMYSIKNVVKMTGLSENYIRKSIMSGQLVTTKELIPGTKISKNWISEEDLNKWNANRKQHSKRDDGRNKFVIYMNQDEVTQLENMLKDLEFGTTLQRANLKVVDEE